MTLHGIVFIDLVGLWLLLWVLSLVRRDRLYVGYGTMFIVLIAVGVLLVSTGPLLLLVTRLVGAVFPASALTMLAIGFLTVMLVYVLSQLTIIANRLAVTVQELAIQRAAPAGPSRVLLRDEPGPADRGGSPAAE